MSIKITARLCFKVIGDEQIIIELVQNNKGAGIAVIKHPEATYFFRQLG